MSFLATKEAFRFCLVSSSLPSLLKDIAGGLRNAFVLTGSWVCRSLKRFVRFLRAEDTASVSSAGLLEFRLRGTLIALGLSVLPIVGSPGVVGGE